ncbi:phosphoesterase family-domain-containing protein [Globomyces pollinis-pini]|nr:phosphoesterase family-domain-containing protein [Globomyces pollinis-pini]
MKLLQLALFGFACALPQPSSDKPFDRFFVITLENTDYEDVLADPYFKSLVPRGRLLTNSHGVTHPSQPNYITMTSNTAWGTFFNFKANFDRENIADTLEGAGKTWVSMQENYPKDKGCFAGDSYPYVRKHNPFMSYNNIRNNPARCKKIVNADQLYVDIEKKQLADYVFYTPNMLNDGHDTSIQYASNWLKGFLEPLLANPYFDRTLFVITFDESEAFLGVIDFEGNHIYTLLIGSGVKAGTTDDTYYEHYSQMALLEKVWGLKSLGGKTKGPCSRFSHHDGDQRTGSSNSSIFETCRLFDPMEYT